MARAQSRSLTVLALLLALSGGCNRKKAAPVMGTTLTITLAGTPRGPRVLPGDRIHSLDPAHADDPASADQTALVYETLYSYHYLKRPYVLVPRLAEAMPVPAKDGRTLTIALRKGVLFEDDRCFADSGGRGRELTAEDVVYTLRRLADPRTGADSAWEQLDGWIGGLADWREALARAGEGIRAASGGLAASPDASGTAPISGLRALDRYRIEIQLTSAALAPALPALLARPFTAIVPHEAVDAYGGELGAHPVGTGPFQLVRMNAATRLVWQRNPTFRREEYPSEGEPSDRAAGRLADAGQLLPLVDQLVVVADDDRDHSWASLLAGETDLAPAPETIPSPLPPGLELGSGVRTGIGYVSFNMKDAFLSRARVVRIAIRLALGSGELPAQTTPSGEVWPPRPDPAQAREVITMAGFPGGMGLPVLDLGYDGASPADRDAVTAIRVALEAAGIRIHPRELKGSELEAEMKLGKIPLWGGAWSGDSAVAEFALGIPSLPEPSASPSAEPSPTESRAATSPATPSGEKVPDTAAGERELNGLLGSLGPDPVSLADRRLLAGFLADDRFAVFGFPRTIRYVVRKRLRNYKPHELGAGMARYYRIDPTR